MALPPHQRRRRRQVANDDSQTSDEQTSQTTTTQTGIYGNLRSKTKTQFFQLSADPVPLSTDRVPLSKTKVCVNKNWRSKEQSSHMKSLAFKESISKLNQLSDELFPYFDEQKEELNKFDILCDLVKNNSVLHKNVTKSIATQLNGITEEIGIKSGDIDERLFKTEAINTQIKADIQSLKQRLKQQKSDKTKAEKKSKYWSKKLDELKSQMNENKETKDTKECKLLAEIMNCKYKLLTNRKVVLYDLDIIKRKQQLISMDNENVFNDFWTFLHKKYSL